MKHSHACLLAGSTLLCFALLGTSLSWGQDPAALPVEIANPTPGVNANPVQFSLGALLNGKNFVRVRAGQFSMGSREGNPDEMPVHNVRISRDFEISKFEVTQAQWSAVMGDSHVRATAPQEAGDVNPSHFKKPSHPVENVGWESVHVFLQRLNQRDQKHLYRLPTEAEWEYSARAGDKKPLPDLAAATWFKHNSEASTHPVGEKKPNAWGLYDMLGNVMEWVEDWYAATYTDGSQTDPRGPLAGSYRVYRGCAWLSESKYCRPAYRGFDFPNKGYYSVGFRVVRDAK